MGEVQRYQVIERIAAGGMAEVFRGESAGIEGFRKKVAIKRVLPKLSANREFINMFLDEARLCAYLSHSKCVQVFDIGQAAGAHFIVMEYVDGADLQGVLEYLSSRGELMSVAAACLITMQVCEGLAYAHDATDHKGATLNIVHRDISPHNVLMTRYGEVKLVDFGLAKASSHLTADDEDIVKGKFGYLAPEVTLGQGADRRVDIFAAGILLWEMLAGRRLFKGDTDVETFKQVQAAQVPDIRQIRPEVSANLVKVLSRALARDPRERYQSANDFARDLSAVTLGLGQAVTYLDLRGLVEATARERGKRKTREKDTAGTIGDLIIDALHDFSADVGAAELHAKPSSLGTKGLAATSGAFEDPSQWLLGDSFDLPGSEPEELADDMVTAAAPAAPAPPPSRAAAPPSTATGGTAPRPPVPIPRAPAPAPPSAGASRATEKKGEGPFWRRWFGG
jgi:serine/threonine-protein kinase